MAEIELYGRVWSVTVSDGPTSYTWRDLPVIFSVKKTADMAPNDGEIKLINLSPKARQFISEPGLKVSLKAGYEKLSAVIFTGNVEKISHARDNGQWITTLSCKDGAVGKRNINISESIDKKTTAEDVIKRIIKKITGEGVQKVTVKGVEPLQEGTINVKPSVPAPAETPKTSQTSRRANKSKAEKQKEAELARSRSAKAKADQATVNLSITVGKTKIIRGNAFDLLTALCESMGLQATMLDNKISVGPKDKPIDTTVSILSKTSGLIGVPELLESGWRFTSLLRSDMAPGKLVRVESGIVSGDYLIKRIEHSGHSESQEWYSKIEGIRQ